MRRNLVCVATLAAGLAFCKQEQRPRKPPKPLVDARVKPKQRDAAVPKEKREIRIVREGHYMLGRNVLWDGIHVFTKVWTIDKDGVEFITEANQFIDRKSRMIRVRYGETKPVGTFMLKAHMTVMPGPDQKSAAILFIYPKEGKK